MSEFHVSLPMYDWPETRDAHDRFYGLLRESLADYGFAPPGELTRDRPLAELWKSPDLLLSQTCGLPFATWLDGCVSLVGTPSYDIECSSGSYFSVVIVAKNSAVRSIADIRGIFARNDTGSQSGYAAPLHHLRQNAPGVLSKISTVDSGNHRNSIKLVAGGGADFAAIDAVTWELARRHESTAKHVRVVARTAETPGLPVITARRPARDVEWLHMAMVNAMSGLDEVDRDALLFTGFARTRPRDYRIIGQRARLLQDSAIPLMSGIPS